MHLDLSINHPVSSTDSVFSCEPFAWIDGNTYSSNNSSATHTLTKLDGCDSVVTLNLIVQTIDNSVSLNGTTIMTNMLNGNYQWLDCENLFLPISGAVSQSFTPTSNGDYAVQIANNGCVDTSNCVLIDFLSLNNLDVRTENNITISPNPTTDNIVIDFPDYSSALIRIYNSTGKLMHEFFEETPIKSTKVHFNYSSGIYILKIMINNEWQEFKVVKN